MPPAPELNTLPPLPVVAEKEGITAPEPPLKPIPSLKTKELPKVIPSGGSPFKPKQETPPVTPGAVIRKITSPFKTVTKQAPAQQKPTPVQQKPTPVQQEPAPVKAPPSQPVKMEAPEIPLPPTFKKNSRVKKSSLTGPVQIRSTPQPTAPTEVMLRNTVRRTLSEQGSGASPFRDVSAFERLRWIIRAFFTSRTFDDIAFEKTRRFRVDEVYLLRKDSLTLVSYASNDPIRHVYPNKIDYDLRHLRAEVQEAITAEINCFKLPAGRTAVIRKGRHTYLIAVIRGPENLALEADLDYTHKLIEHQVGKRITDETSNFTFPLQPLLEDCLLIQSPAAPA